MAKIGELFKAGIAVGFMLIVQIVANYIGFGGVGFAISLYFVTMLFTRQFNIDPAGFVAADDAVSDPKTRMPAKNYLVRTGVTFGLMIVGFFLWLIVGVIHGIDRTFSGAQKPEIVMQDLAGNNFFLKILYLTITHLTLYSFSRFWINLFDTCYAYYLEWIGK